MTMMIQDRLAAKDILDQRRSSGNDRWDEVWDGVYILMPNPNVEHQGIATNLAAIFCTILNSSDLARAYQGVNVSDQAEDWTRNYRCPDVVVGLAGGSAKNCDTHWYGGPDLVVEIASPGQDPRDKNDFYAAVGTRGVLIVERDPWALELFQLDGDVYHLVGRSDDTNGTVLPSSVLPLTFALRAAAKRPEIVVTHTTTGQAWTA